LIPGTPLVGQSDVLASLKPILDQARLERGSICAVIGGGRQRQDSPRRSALSAATLQ
jgi:hypothetical protein